MLPIPFWTLTASIAVCGALTAFLLGPALQRELAASGPTAAADAFGADRPET